MKKLFFCILSLAASGLAAATLEFDRPSPAGEIRSAAITLFAGREYLFDIPGAEKDVKRTEDINISFFGTLKTVSANKYGEPEKMEITPSFVSAKSNGKLWDVSALNGKTVTADLSQSPCSFSFASGGKKLEGGELMIYSALFRRNAAYPLSAVFGKNRSAAVGTRWTPDVSPLISGLAERGLKFAPEDLSAVAAVSGSERAGDTECLVIAFEVNTKKSSEADFRIRTKFHLPADPAKGGIRRMTRTGIEVVDRRVPDSDPFAGGAKVRVVSREHLTVTLTPGGKSAEKRTAPGLF